VEDLEEVEEDLVEQVVEILRSTLAVMEDLHLTVLVEQVVVLQVEI
jgi:hypothetical protein